MAKPPKKISVTAAADTTVTTRPVQSGSGSRITTNTPDLPLSGIDSTTGSPATSTTATRQPAIIVNEIPDSYSAARNAIAWPENRLNELTPIAENNGLFTGPDQRTYAQIGSEGRFVVEQDLHGNYYVPLTFAPGVPGPVLIRMEGQASWHIQRPGWQSTQTRAGTPALAHALYYLAPDDANTLTKAELSTAGIRYNKRKHTFVDTAEGTVMVRRNEQGEYQYSSATTRDVLDVYFEQIPASTLWRRKTPDSPAQETPVAGRRRPIVEPDEPQPGPSKRARLGAPKIQQDPQPFRPTPRRATPFSGCPGASEQPSTGESVQLGWFHIRLCPLAPIPRQKSTLCSIPICANTSRRSNTCC
jgi:hypothetical protein